MKGGEGFGRLLDALETVGDDRLLAVIQIIDRLQDRGQLDVILDRVRPRLASLRPPRPLTLRRLLTYPLEPALVTDHEWLAGSYRIPRSHLPSLHAAILDRPDFDLARRLSEEIAGATSHDGELILAKGRELWPAAAAVLTSLLEARGCHDASLRVSFRLAAHLLAIGEWLVPALWRLPPKPIVEFQPWIQQTIAELLARAAERGRECVLLVCDLLVRMCDSPTLILEPLLNGEHALAARERAQAAVAIVDNVLGELDRNVRAAMESPAWRPSAVADLVLRVVGVVGSLDTAPEGLEADRYALRKLVAATAALAERTVASLLEGNLLKAFAASGDRLPGEVEDAARAVSQIRLVARPLGLISKLDFLLRRAEREFLAALERFLGERRAQDGSPSTAALDLMDRIRIIEILFGSSVALRVWRSWRAGTGVASRLRS